MESQKESRINHNQRKPSGNIALFLSLPVLSWAFYDFANTIFSSNINTIFFPFYVEESVGTNEQMKQIASTFISYANSIASFFLVLFAPLFGVLIDRTGQKKKYIMMFTLISVCATFLMGVFAQTNLEATLWDLPLSIILVILFFIIAKFFFNSSLVFYDSMIGDLGTKEQIPLISGFGVAVGYIGTLVGLAVYPFVDAAYQAFIPTAILYLIFSIPLFIVIKDTPIVQTEKKSIFSGYKDIYKTFKDMKSYRNIFTFMLAYFFINDALATAIALMAVYATAIVGFSSDAFVLLYLVSTVTSIIGSFVFGYITKAVGAKRAVTFVGILLVVSLLIAVFAVSTSMFWIAGSLFGVSLGSMWVTSRTLIVELTPDEKRGEFFGLFAFSGKVSAIIGPLVYGTITLLLSDYGNIASRIAMGSMIILAFIGLIIHTKVRTEKI
ncbi:MFS transporter [Bacillus coahuilensis]|uniref:MFS transporter n=1 Tax=Bacillus coahuilensis TaxID=408580 RepID=UPI0009EA0F22|nr:MFS transporter [Bacillus coahuilensis]